MTTAGPDHDPAHGPAEGPGPDAEPGSPDPVWEIGPVKRPPSSPSSGSAKSDGLDPVTRRTMLTISTMLGLTGLYGLYSNLVNGLIESPSLRSTVRRDTAVPPPRNSVQMAERFLPSAPWAANAKYQMRTKEAFVYFEEWKRVNEHEAVRFWPFAMIWIHNEDALREGPVTVVSDSAFVKFANKFEITNDPGRVIAGALEGNAAIRGPNGLAVDGRYFSYSESLKRIWSDEPLTFAYGRNSGDAVGAQVELHLNPSPGSSSHAVSGMQSVRLKSQVRMHLVSEPGESTPFGDGDAGESSEAHITSDGPFHYDVDKLVARYDTNVLVESPTKPGEKDTLAAEQLVVTFAPNPEGRLKPEPEPDPEIDGPPPTPETGQFRTFETDLVFRKLHAEGPNVRLHSDERGVTGLMRKLDYDAETRVVEMQHDGQVRVQHAGSELRSPAIKLVHAEEGGDLESILCTGAGQMRHVEPESGRTDLEAGWERRMQIHPADENGIESLDLEGKAVVRQTLEDSAMEADFIRLWFTRDEEADVSPLDPANDDPASGLNPQRLLALDDVAMRNPRLLARTQRLEVWFEDPNESEAPVQATAHRVRRRPTTTPLAAGPIAAAPMRVASSTPSPSRVAATPGRPSSPSRRPVGQTFLSTDDTAATSDAPVDAIVDTFDSPVAEKPKDGPIEVDADLIRVRAVRTSGSELTAHPLAEPERELEIRELWTFGNVHVRQKHVDGEPPLDVVGDRIHVVNRGPDRELLHVLAREPEPGQLRLPAHVRDRGMHVEGDRIHLDRETNRAWVEGPGILQLPVDQMPDGRKLEAPVPLDVAWTDSMDFDGRLATFLGRVRTTIDGSLMQCAEMQVVLSEPIAFTDAALDPNREPKRRGAKRPEPELKSIRCLDGVVFDQRQYEGSRLVAVRRGECWQFDLDRSTGDTVATGPGWVNAWQRSRGAGNAASIVRVNGSVDNNAGEWEYTRIVFEGRNVGNIDSRVSKFLDRVVITHGPVAEPLDVIDPDRLPRDGVWIRSDELDIKQFERTPTSPAYFTALASGNVHLRGREPGTADAQRANPTGSEFHARADEVAFDQSKGRYLLRSKGEREASIWRRGVTGEYEEQLAKRMEFVPSRDIIRFDRSAGLGGSH